MGGKETEAGEELRSVLSRNIIVNQPKSTHTINANTDILQFQAVSTLEQNLAMQISTETEFPLGPVFFYWIKIRRVGRQKQHMDIFDFADFRENFFPVKACIVHDYGVSSPYRLE
jgi:hypothetical protein